MVHQWHDAILWMHGVLREAAYQLSSSYDGKRRAYHFLSVGSYGGGKDMSTLGRWTNDVTGLRYPRTPRPLVSTRGCDKSTFGVRSRREAGPVTTRDVDVL